MSLIKNISEADLIDPKFRKQLLKDLKTKLAEQSLYEFIKQAWEVTQGQKFIDNWHTKIICKLYQKVSEGKIKRLIINIPPGLGKSVNTSLWLAWDWIHNPNHQSIYATYTDSLSVSLSKKHRDLVNSKWFQTRWGAGTYKDIYIDKENTRKKKEFENNHKGSRFSCGKRGEVTGRHGHILVFDDLNMSQDASGKTGIIGAEIAKGVEFLTETLWNRQIPTHNPKEKTAIVGICQRLHHADVAEYCINRRNSQGLKEFVHLNLPMEAIYHERTMIFEMPDGSYSSALGPMEAKQIIEAGGELWWEDSRKDGELLCPQLKSKKEVVDFVKTYGPSAYSAQMQQKPTPPGGAMIKEDWIKFYDLDALKTQLFSGQGRTIITVDCATSEKSTADWTVAQLWREYKPKRTHPSQIIRPEYYLIDQERTRTNIFGIVDLIQQLHTRNPGPKKVVVEKAAGGTAVIAMLEQLIKENLGITVEGYNPRTGKESRVEAIAPLLEKGQVFFPQTQWMTYNQQELTEFPYSRWDDTVDCTSLALLSFSVAMQQDPGDVLAKIVAAQKKYRRF